MNYSQSLKSISRKLGGELLLGTVARILLPLPTFIALRSLSVSPLLDFLVLLIATCFSVNTFCLTIVDNFILPQLLRSAHPDELKPTTLKLSLFLAIISYFLALFTVGILYFTYHDMHPNVNLASLNFFYPLLYTYPIFSALSVVNQYFLSLNIQSSRFHISNIIFILSSVPAILCSLYFSTRVGPLILVIITCVVSTIQIVLYLIDLQNSPQIYGLQNSNPKNRDSLKSNRQTLHLKGNYYVLISLILSQAGSFVVAITPLFASLTLSDTNNLVFIQSRKIFDLIPALIILPCITILSNRLAKLAINKSDTVTPKYLIIFITFSVTATFLLISFSPFFIKVVYGNLFSGSDFLAAYRSLSLLLFGLPVVAINAIISRIKILLQIPSEVWQATLISIIPLIILPPLTKIIVDQYGFYGVSLSLAVYFWLVHLPALVIIEFLVGKFYDLLNRMLHQLIPTFIFFFVINLPFIMPLIKNSTSSVYFPSFLNLISAFVVNVGSFAIISAIQYSSGSRRFLFFYKR